jgi:hypothetical protein
MEKMSNELDKLAIDQSADHRKWWERECGLHWQANGYRHCGAELGCPLCDHIVEISKNETWQAIDEMRPFRF